MAVFPAYSSEGWRDRLPSVIEDDEVPPGGVKMMDEDGDTNAAAVCIEPATAIRLNICCGLRILFLLHCSVEDIIV